MQIVEQLSTTADGIVIDTLNDPYAAAAVDWLAQKVASLLTDENNDMLQDYYNDDDNLVQRLCHADTKIVEQ